MVGCMLSINYIVLDDYIDIVQKNKDSYASICAKWRYIISRLEELDRNYIMNVIVQLRRKSIRDNIYNSIPNIVSRKYGESIIHAIEVEGFTELEDTYPMKITFETGLLAVYFKEKFSEKKVDDIFKAHYITCQYATNKETDFLEIRRRALKAYQNGDYINAMAKMKILNENCKIDFVIELCMGAVFAFYYADKKRAIEKFISAVNNMIKYNYLVKETAQLLYVIGCMYMYDNDYNKAVHYFEKAIYTYKDTEFIYKLSQAYALNGNTEECLDTLSNLINENIHYSIFVQYSLNYYGMKKNILKFLKDLSNKVISEYEANISAAYSNIVNIDIDLEIEGTEDIKEEMLKLSSKISAIGSDVGLIEAYRNKQLSNNYMVICEIYAKTFKDAINIKNRISKENLKLKSINKIVNDDAWKKVIELNDKHEKLIGEAEKLDRIEQIWRKVFFAVSLFSILAMWSFLDYRTIEGLILVTGWLITMIALFRFNVFKARAEEIRFDAQKVSKNIESLQNIRREQWEMKRNIEKQIKIGIYDMCIQYNNMLNGYITDVNRNLGLSIGEVKINFI